MILNLRIVKIDSNYCDYLRTFDYRVSYNKYDKLKRPYIGILFKINEIEYFAPLSSPKPKHQSMKNSIDFYKIKDGSLGVINFNNMIPVLGNNYKLIDFNGIDNMNYQKLLKEQLAWLNAHIWQVKDKSYKLYNLYIQNRLPNAIKMRCCDFKLLEEKCVLYKKF